jgi:hypothetical protein
MQKAFD